MVNLNQVDIIILKPNLKIITWKAEELTKTIIRSHKIDTYTRLEILPGLKLSEHTDTLTEASNLIDELYKKREIQIEREYRNAPNKFST